MLRGFSSFLFFFCLECDFFNIIYDISPPCTCKMPLAVMQYKGEMGEILKLHIPVF